MFVYIKYTLVWSQSQTHTHTQTPIHAFCIRSISTCSGKSIGYYCSNVNWIFKQREEKRENIWSRSISNESSGNREKDNKLQYTNILICLIRKQNRNSSKIIEKCRNIVCCVCVPFRFIYRCVCAEPTLHISITFQNSVTHETKSHSLQPRGLYSLDNSTQTTFSLHGFHTDATSTQFSIAYDFEPHWIIWASNEHIGSWLVYIIEKTWIFLQSELN